MPSYTLKISASRVVIDSSMILDNATVIVRDGMVAKVGPTEALENVKADKVIKLANHIVYPGFINAHCHLELSHMKGKISRRSPFTGWIKELIAIRAGAGKKEVDDGIKAGIRRLIETGTTCVGDVTLSGRVSPILNRSGLRAVIFHEVLGFDPAQVDIRLKDLKLRVEKSVATDLLANGVSPHAVYSVSQKLMKQTARFAKKTGAPLAIHLCETEAEAHFSSRGKGEFKTFLESIGAHIPGGYPGLNPVNAVSRTGAMDNALLIHMNHPNHGDLAELVRKKAKVVVCPNSNRWFRRKIDHPILKLMKRKIPVGLGTDSLASNDDLDIRAEVRRIMANFPELSVADAFDLATVGGAQALGLPEKQGTLRVGAPFDAVAVDLQLNRRSDPLLAIIRNEANVSKTWVGGKLLKL
jgi:cytosine/adenosine deaminase-related metal-dependent hydrolase